MKIAVLTDSGSNYYHEKIKEKGLYCIPLQVIDNNIGYREGIEKTTAEIYQMLEAGKMLKTSAPVVEDIMQAVQQIKDDGYQGLLSVNITGGLSSTMATVEMCAKDIGLTCYSFDCYTTARVQLECALSATKLLNQGKSIDEVLTALETIQQNSLTFVLPKDINHLIRGGRITPLVGKIAGFFKISPILWVSKETGGKNDSFKNVRTFKKALATVADYFASHHIDSSYRICIAHVNNLVDAHELAQMMKEKLKDIDYYITDLVSVVGVHTGLGTVACQFVKKSY